MAPARCSWLPLGLVPALTLNQTNFLCRDIFIFLMLFLVFLDCPSPSYYAGCVNWKAQCNDLASVRLSVCLSRQHTHHDTAGINSGPTIRPNRLVHLYNTSSYKYYLYVQHIQTVRLYFFYTPHSLFPITTVVYALHFTSVLS